MDTGILRYHRIHRIPYTESWIPSSGAIVGEPFTIIIITMPAVSILIKYIILIARDSVTGFFTVQ